MPCTICNSKIIYLNDIPTCPSCKHLSIVPYDEALQIADFNIKIFKNKFSELIREFDKNDLLLNVFWVREKEIIKFNEVYSTLNLPRLRTTSLLLRRIIYWNNFLNKQKVSENYLEQIIRSYIAIADAEEDRIKLEAKTYTMINLKKYDINNLESLSQINGFITCPNENYGRVMQAFAKHNIMSQQVADKKLKEWSKDFIPSKFGSNKLKTSKETIETFYELISTLYTAFLRNKVCKEAFQITNETLFLNPIDIKKLLGRYIISHENLTKIDYKLFKEDLIMIFKSNYHKIISYFVLSEDNPTAMPIFIRIDDTIYVSQAFGELYCYFLHAIINKDEFDNETNLRSKIYEEKMIRKYFEEKGFTYYNSFQIKNKMEIDGIATSESHAYVIEAKGWGSQKLIEEKSSQDILTREIKNAIDGIHVHQKTKKLRIKVPMIKKIEWVSSNRELFKIKKDVIIKGILVINEPPTITNYNNCDVVFIDDFVYSKTGKNVNDD